MTVKNLFLRLFRIPRKSPSQAPPVVLNELGKNQSQEALEKNSSVNSQESVLETSEDIIGESDFYVISEGRKVYISELPPEIAMQYSNFITKFNALEWNDVETTLVKSRELKEAYLMASWKSDTLNATLIDACIIEPSDVQALETGPTPTDSSKPS